MGGRIRPVSCIVSAALIGLVTATGGCARVESGGALPAAAPPSGSTAPAATPATPPLAACADVEVTVGSATPVAGDQQTFKFELRLRNSAATDCLLSGFPGVSFAGADGRVLDVPRSAASYQQVRLSPGATGHSELVTKLGDNATGWHVSKMNVTPPNGTKAVPVTWPHGPFVLKGDQIAPGNQIGPVLPG
ncbi:DUF4232 domain-containing protein [Lentzea sp. NPDC051213]|uniref:DUF4232 domain-containing protein n=1 Tax=Lentzea sp. NPDC051213 TaxID=3364126 RepID=UPI0037AE2C33